MWSRPSEQSISSVHTNGGSGASTSLRSGVLVLLEELPSLAGGAGRCESLLNPDFCCAVLELELDEDEDEDRWLLCDVRVREDRPAIPARINAG